MFGFFNTKKKKGDEMSFLDHVEDLRWHLVRSAFVIMVLAGVAFVYKDILFGVIVLGPSKEGFVTYNVLCNISHKWDMGEMLCFTEFNFTFQNTDVTGQFTLHMWAAFVAGLIAGFPYLLWELWKFIRPALKPKETRAAKGFIFYASVLFLTGVLFSYYIIVPMAVYFLGNYQVDPDIKNNFTIDSYISVVTTLVLMMGIVFELPIIVYFLARFGVMSSEFMRKHRKHAVIVILIVSAVITPTTDVFTQMLVAFPLWLLYESSIFVARRVEKKRAEQDAMNA